MTPLKTIGASLAALLLLPVMVLSALAGGGGDVAGIGSSSDLIRDVLSDPAISFTAAARSDVESGRVDPRVLSLLLAVAQIHELAPVGPLITGHSTYVKGTDRMSNHVAGRAVDILGVDGAPVSPSNDAAREVMQLILELPPSLQPDELGGPFLLPGGSVRVFTKDHDDHIHVGWDA